ncbi:MAG TPA: M48 family metallopeptidase, partial [Polyangiales bacterium]|nr:M48 family metallopeptidase [Polyangiales bacterium]
WRAVLALSLMVGFYILALGLAALLLYIPYAELRYAHRLHFQILAPCAVAAFVIVRSVLPRFDRFEAPGLLLSADTQPELFAVIRELATATEQPPPKDVFLVSDMNAFVTQRGGLMGFGSHRVLGIGLPILQALSVRELRAVLAHEFGHFHGGDVQLGPWIYKTRAAIIRTIVSLAQERSIFHKPFLWYGEMFIKITHAISRNQELAADALAARTVGAQALISGLKRTHAAALAYNVYWQEDMLPALGSGWRPPLAAGFAQFLGAKRAQRLMDESVAHELDSGKADPYDTHPSLRERVQALESMRDRVAHDSDDERAAVSLLADLAAIEKLLVEHMAADKSEAARLKPIAWTDVPASIHVPNWRAMVGRLAPQFAGHSLLQLPAAREFRVQLGRSVAGEHGNQLDDDTLLRLGAARIAGVVVLGLVELGYVLDCAPGEAVTLSRNGASVQPFAILLDDSKSDQAIDDLRAACAAAGVGDLDLGAIAARAQAAAPASA